MSENLCAEIKVSVEFEDVNKIYYDAKVKVLINSKYEVEESAIEYIEAFDENGEPVEGDLQIATRLQIEALGAMKAIEKAQAEDFHKEAEMEYE